MLKSILTILAIGFTCLLMGQATDSYTTNALNEGINAVENKQFKQAKSIFKDARKYARKNKFTTDRKTFDELVKKVGHYEKYENAYQLAENHVKSGSYKYAVETYRNARRLLNKSRKIVHTSLNDFDSNLNSQLKEEITRVNNLRIVKYKEYLAKAERQIETERYDSASRNIAYATELMFTNELSPNRVSTLSKKAKAGQYMTYGDSNMAKENYAAALKWYSKSDSVYRMPTIDAKISGVKSTVCKKYDTSTLALVKSGKTEVSNAKVLVAKCNCSSTIVTNINKAVNYFQIMEEATDLESYDTKAALAKYKSARNIAATATVKERIKKFEPATAVANTTVVARKTNPKTITTTGYQAQAPLVKQRTRSAFISKDLGGYCPYRGASGVRTYGDAEFGGGVWARADLEFYISGDSRSVYMKTFLKLDEDDNGDTKIHATWTRKIYTAPSGSKIKSFAHYGYDEDQKGTKVYPSVVRTKLRNFKYPKGYGHPKADAIYSPSEHKLRGSGPDGPFGNCAKGYETILGDWTKVGNSSWFSPRYPNGFDASIKVLGDTGHVDVGTDPNCHCDARVISLKISNLEVVLSY